MAATKGPFEYYNTFKGFKKLNSHLTEELERIIASVLKKRGINSAFGGHEELFDMIKNFNINNLDKVDEAAEVNQDHAIPVSVVRPQVVHKWDIDNSSAVFLPPIKYKPHSLKPLSFLLETEDTGLELKILDEVARGVLSKSQIAENFQIAKSTLSTILKNKEKIDAAVASGSSSSSKRLRKASHQDVEDELLKWFKKSRQNNISVSGALVKEKAKEISVSLAVENFKCSDGWLWRFQRRNIIASLVVSGEINKVSEETVTDWLNKFEEIKNEYKDEDIFNIDETGVFYNLLPDRSLDFKGTKCHGTLDEGLNIRGSPELEEKKKKKQKTMRSLRLRGLSPEGHHKEPTMLKGEPGETSAQVPSTYISLQQPRYPSTFVGDGSEDAQRWLKDYQRVAKFNRWDDSMCLANVIFFLAGTARQWYENNEDLLTSWEVFQRALGETFGQQEEEMKKAEIILKTRAQKSSESSESYIQDVLYLCQLANPLMDDETKLGHLMRGIAEDIYQILIAKDVEKVDQFLKECRKIELMKKRRITASKFERLPNVALVAYEEEDLPSMIRRIVQEEFQKVKIPPTACFLGVEQKAESALLEDLIKREVKRELAPITRKSSFPRPQRSYTRPLPPQRSPENSEATNAIIDWGTGEMHLEECASQGIEDEDLAVYACEDCIIPGRSISKIAVISEKVQGSKDLIVEGHKYLLLKKELAIPSSVINFHHGRGDVWVTNATSRNQIIPAGMLVGNLGKIGNSGIFSMDMDDCKEIRTNIKNEDIRQNILSLVDDTLSKEQRSNMAECLLNFAEIFDFERRASRPFSGVKHKIDTSDNRPIKQRPYRVSPTERRAIQGEVDKMIKMGVAQPSESPWSSPVVLLKKKDGSWNFAWIIEGSIGSRKRMEHMERLEKVLKCIQRAGLFLNPEKCRFGSKIIKVLGHSVSEEGIRPDPGKIEAIIHFPTPKNTTDVRSFIGLCSYYRRFVRNFANKAKPLHELLKNNTRFVWSKEQDESFQILKAALTTDPLLGHYKEEAETHLHTDASGHGIGAILIQIHEGEEKPIAYASRTLNAAEKNYSTTERECLAVVWAIYKFRPYLFGKHFTVVSDHHSLCWLANIKDPSGRLARWALRLQEFDISIVYKSGIKHQDADCLSRNPLLDTDENKIPELISITDVRKEKERDDQITKIIQGSQSKGDGDFKLIEGILYRKNYDPMGKMWLLVVPKQMRINILREAHDSPMAGHLGFAKTYDRVRKKYFWPGMYRSVKQYVSHCRECQGRKGSTGRPPGQLVPIPPVVRPFQRVGIDLLGRFPVSNNGNKWIVVATDYLSRYAMTRAIPNGSAEEVGKFMIEDVLLKHGAPRELISDRGRTFISRTLKEINDLCGTIHRFTSAYHPQTNGLTERLNKTLADMLSMYVDVEQRNWDAVLPYVTFAYNTSQQESTGFSPFYLIHGRDVETPLDTILAYRENTSLEDYVESMVTNAEDARQLARLNILRSQERDKSRYDQCHRPVHYQTGDLVWVFTPVRRQGLAEKLLKRYFGPYRVNRQLSEVTYEVEPLWKKDHDNGKQKISMSEGEKVSHLIKGVAEEVYQALVGKDISTVDQFVAFCRRFEAFKRMRVAPPRFNRLPNVTTISTAEPENLEALIRRIVREEVQKFMAPPSTFAAQDIDTPPPDLRDVIRSEIQQTLAPISAPRQPESFRPRRQYLPQNDQGYRRRTEGPPNNQRTQWRTEDDRPICFHCGRPGHVARYCRDRRQAFADARLGRETVDFGRPRTENYTMGESGSELSQGRFRNPSPYPHHGRFQAPRRTSQSPARRPSRSPSRRRRNVQALVDSGADYSVISEAFRRSIKAPVFKENGPLLRAADKKPIVTLGKCSLEVQIKGLDIIFDFVVAAECSHDVILGWDFFRATDAIIDCGKNKLYLSKAEKSYEWKDLKLCAAMDCVLPPISFGKIVVTNQDVFGSRDVVVTGSKRLQLEKGLFIPSSLVRFLHGRAVLWVTNSTHQSQVIPSDMKIGTMQDLKVGSISNLDACSEIAGKDEVTCPDVRECLISMISTDLEETKKNRLLTCLNEFSDIFDFEKKSFPVSGEIKHKIDTSDYPPVRQRPYTVSPAERRVIQSEVEKMMETKIIRPSSSPWASPVILVRKKDGSLRFCVDYRRLNKMTKKDVYPLPRIDDALDTLSGSRYFSTMDMRSGYWQIEVDDKDREKTAFITPDGLYEFNVMPFGLCNAPATFERMIDNVLRGLKWDMCLCYLDDIVVYGSTFKEHLTRLHKVLRCIQQAGLCLNYKKCHFASRQIIILGHVVNEFGTQPDPKVKAIVHFPKPRNISMFEKFDENLENVENYIYRLKQFMLISKTKEDFKTPFLISSIGPKYFGILRNLVFPEEVDQVPFDKLCMILLKHFNPKTNIIYERFIFQKMDQKSGETISKYMIRLKEQAQRCNFGDFLQESLRDRFVAGIIDTSTQKKLLQEEGLTFDGALDIALSAESADNDLHNIKGSENAHQSPQHLHAINNACKHCDSLLNDYESIFEYKSGPIKGIKCHPDVKAEFIPKFYKFRQVPFALKQLVEDEIDKLVDLNILSPIDRSDCASPLVCVAKPDGQIRLCADFKKSLNPYLEDVKYPIPNIDLVLSNFQGKKLFTKLDLSKAYHQIEMDDISKKYLVVSTHKDLAHPLCNLLKKNVKWSWNAGTDRSFNSCKNALDETTCLSHYSLNLPLILSCDASQVGIGATLSHLKDGEERPVCFISRTLNVHERKYSQVEREGLAIVFAVNKLKNYLFGRKFTIYTDHKPLITIFGDKTNLPPLIANRLHRWALTLSNFSFEIKYKKGKDNIIPDFLSRFPEFQESNLEYNDGSGEILLLNTSIIDHVLVAHETQLDRTLFKLYKIIETGELPSSPNDDLIPYLKRIDDFTILQKCIFLENRMVIPKSLHERVLQLLHESHAGTNKMKMMARSSIWWPGMDSSIEIITKNCRTCLSNESLPPQRAESWPKYAGPWRRVHMDYFNFKNKLFLLAVDSFSSWVEVSEVPSTSAYFCMNFMRNCIARYGFPQVVVSDNGPPFFSSDFGDFLSKNGISHVTSPPYHPKSNGQAEVSVREVKKLLKKQLYENEQVELDLALSRALFFIRTDVNIRKGTSPAELFLGRKIRSRLSVLSKEEVKVSKVNSQYVNKQARNTHVHTDASGYGLGAVLVQIQNDAERPIAYASRTLTKAENNYSTTEKECLAVVWALGKFRPYLYGRPFTVVTDHPSLCWLVGLKDPSGRLARWALKLQEYDINIVYKSGRKHKDADCLSRSPLADTAEIERHITSIQDIAEEQSKDPHLVGIREKLANENLKGYQMIGGDLYKKNYDPEGKPWLLVVPKQMRHEILKDVHDTPMAGHLGFAKTYDRVRKRFYWPGLYRTVSQYIAHCKECQRRKGVPQKPPGLLVPIPPSPSPFQKIGIDYLGRFPISHTGNRWIIVATDYLTRFAITKAAATAEATELATFLIEDVILKHGAPREIITDRGRNFMSQTIREINNLNGPIHRFTTAYHPQTNGLTERLNKTLTDMISMYVDVDQKNWDNILPNVTFAYNTARQETTGYSPFFLVHGREVETPLDSILPYQPAGTAEDYVGHLVTNAEDARMLARLNILQAQSKDKERYDKKHQEVTYKEGDLVWVFTPVRTVGLSEKLLKRYFWPYRVIRKISSVNYQVEGVTNTRRRRKTQDIVHVVRMKPYHDREVQEQIAQ
ncbi:hypothetical protein LAZ67_21001753, partial [Cordylochernes scorpioides]